MSEPYRIEVDEPQFDDLKAAAQAVVDECQRRIKDGDNSIPWLDMTVLKEVLAECPSACSDSTLRWRHKAGGADDLESVEADLRSLGVRDVKIEFDPRVAGMPLSDVKRHVAIFLRAYLDRMSDTPRTDAVDIEENWDTPDKLADLCRILERENVALREEAKVLAAELHDAQQKHLAHMKTCHSADLSEEPHLCTDCINLGHCQRRGECHRAGTSPPEEHRDRAEIVTGYDRKGNRIP